jgi:hypothetical protein
LRDAVLYAGEGAFPPLSSVTAGEDGAANSQYPCP